MEKCENVFYTSKLKQFAYLSKKHEMFSMLFLQDRPQNDSETNL